MKKMACLFIVITLLFSITACSLRTAKNDKMYIQKATLTDQEQSILDLVGSEKMPYILGNL